MSVFIDTTGESVLGVGICGRCGEKFPLLKLQPDRNSPGLYVCEKDNDEFDPYRLPPRQPDNLILPFYRPDLPVDGGLNSPGVAYGGLILEFILNAVVIIPGSQVDLSWNSDLGFEVSRFEVYAYYDVDNPTDASFTLIATLAGTATSYSDLRGYTSSVQYKVIAVGTESRRAYGVSQRFTLTTDGPVPAPSVIGAFDTDVSYYSTFMLTAVPYGGPIELFFEWSLDSNPFDPTDGIWYPQEDFEPFPSVVATTSLAIFTSLGVSTISYRLKARFGVIESAYSNIVHAFNLSATLVSFTEVDLAWATPDVPFTEFEIYAYHDIGHDPPVIGDFTLLASVDEFTFNYTDNTPFSTNYGYYVRAIGTGDDAFTPAALWRLLPAPINLQITYPVFSFLPLLSWDASTDPQVTGYRIEQIYYDSATGDALPPNFTDVGTNSYGGLLGFVYGLIRIRVCCLNAGGVEVSPFSDYIYYISGTGCVPYADGSGLSSPFLPAFPTTLGALSASLYFFGPEDATSDPADRGSFGSVGIVAPPTGAEYTYIPPHNHGVNPLGVNCEWWYFWRVTFDGQTFESNLFDQNEPIFHPPGGTPPGQ